jgi:hypothetical protein
MAEQLVSQLDLVEDESLYETMLKEEILKMYTKVIKKRNNL